MLETLTAPAYPLWAVILAGILGAGLARVITPRAPSPSRSSETELLILMSRVGPKLRSDVEDLLRRSRMIEAVRLVREELGCGLKEAKDIVDRIRSVAR